MAGPLPPSLAEVLLGWTLGAADGQAANRLSLAGLSTARTDGDLLQVRLGSLEAASLRFASGGFTVEVGGLVVRDLAGRLRVDGGTPRLVDLHAASAELSAVRVHGPLELAAGPDQLPAGSWTLEPLAAANGTLRAEIVDAHLLFDADVTVPIRQGQVNLNETTVSHVGPDSRMGVSRLGLYVDAPNGRSYLFQFPATLAGVTYERRGALLGARVSDRGQLRLQEFGESLLRQAAGGPALSFTAQARQLFERTAVSGDVRLGDGKMAAGGAQLDLAGRAEGRNVVHVHSEAVGKGITAEIASLLLRHALLRAGEAQLACDEISGAVVARVFVEGGQLRLRADLRSLSFSALRLQQHAPASPAPG